MFSTDSKTNTDYLTIIQDSFNEALKALFSANLNITMLKTDEHTLKSHVK